MTNPDDNRAETITARRCFTSHHMQRGYRYCFKTIEEMFQFTADFISEIIVNNKEELRISNEGILDFETLISHREGRLTTPTDDQIMAMSRAIQWMANVSNESKTNE